MLRFAGGSPAAGESAPSKSGIHQTGSGYPENGTADDVQPAVTVML